MGESVAELFIVRVLVRSFQDDIVIYNAICIVNKTLVRVHGALNFHTADLMSPSRFKKFFMEIRHEFLEGVIIGC